MRSGSPRARPKATWSASSASIIEVRRVRAITAAAPMPRVKAGSTSERRFSTGSSVNGTHPELGSTPGQVEAEDEDEHQAEPEAGDREGHDAADPDDPVEQPAATGGGEGAGEHADRRPDHERDQAELEGHEHPVAEQLGDRRPGRQRPAQVEGERRCPRR